MSGNVLATQLERLCQCIADHVQLVSGHLVGVEEMIVHFNIDAEDRVWFLWSALRDLPRRVAPIRCPKLT